ncbi:hypothetical protein D3C81_2185390 [compost metagenome]
MSTGCLINVASYDEKVVFVTFFDEFWYQFHHGALLCRPRKHLEAANNVMRWLGSIDFE